LPQSNDRALARNRIISRRRDCALHLPFDKDART
jgi:hypothetical protein